MSGGEHRARFDHLMCWVGDVGQCVDVLRRAGESVKVRSPEPGRPSHSAFWWFENSYLELIEPAIGVGSVSDEQAAGSPYRPFLENMQHDIRQTLEQGGGPLSLALEPPSWQRGLASLEDAAQAPPSVLQGVGGPGQLSGAFQLAWTGSGPRWRPFFFDYGRSLSERLALVDSRGDSGRRTRLRRITVRTPRWHEDLGFLTRLLGPAKVSGASAAFELSNVDLVLEAGPEDAVTSLRLLSHSPRTVRLPGLTLEWAGESAG